MMVDGEQLAVLPRRVVPVGAALELAEHPGTGAVLIPVQVHPGTRGLLDGDVAGGL